MVLWPCLALTLTLGFLSDGGHQDDDLTHFLMARWARWFPEYLLHNWGRPGLTIPLAGVAWVGGGSTGWHACRALSATVTAATALLAAWLATRLGLRKKWLVVLACYMLPLNALLACTTLTENFAALYLLGATVLYYAGRPSAAGAIFSLALVTRHEIVVLLPIWWIALLSGRGSPRRKVVAFALSIWAPVTHNLLFWLVFGQWPVRLFMQPHGSSEHLAAGLLGYVPHALYAVPPAMAGLALIGGIALCRRGRFLVPALAAIYFATHIVVTAFGLFASGGYGRFMVAVAPLIAVLVVAGWEDMAARLHERRAAPSGWLVIGAVWTVALVAVEVEHRADHIRVPDVRWLWSLRVVAGLVIVLTLGLWISSRRGRAGLLRSVTVAILMAACVFQWLLTVRPLKLRDEQQIVRRVVDWMEQQRLDEQPFFAAHPWFAYFLDLVERPRAHKGPVLLASMPVGTVFVWDSVYSGSDFHGLPPAETFRADSHYRWLKTVRSEGPDSVEMHVFLKVGRTPVPQTIRPHYPPNLMAARDPWRGVYTIRPEGKRKSIRAKTGGDGGGTGPNPPR